MTNEGLLFFLKCFIEMQGYEWHETFDGDWRICGSKSTLSDDFCLYNTEQEAILEILSRINNNKGSDK